MKYSSIWSGLSVFLVVPIWAFDYTVTKIALQGLDPLVYASMRFVLASILLFFIQLRYPKPNYSSREIWKIIAAGVVGVSIYQAAYTTGLNFISAGEAALLIAASPIFTVFLAASLGIEKITILKIVGGILAIIGVGLIVTRGISLFPFKASTLIGYILALVTAAAFGFRSVILQEVLEQYSAIPTVSKSIFVGTAVLLLISIPSFLHQNWDSVTNLSWLAVCYGGIFSTTIGYILWYRGIGLIGATKTMFYYYLVPLVAVLFAVFFLGEHITFTIVVGGLLTLLGVILAVWKPIYPREENNYQRS
ncbi:DMT family transporter [Chloroflexota bacterium]